MRRITLSLPDSQFVVLLVVHRASSEAGKSVATATCTWAGCNWTLDLGRPLSAFEEPTEQELKAIKAHEKAHEEQD